MACRAPHSVVQLRTSWPIWCARQEGLDDVADGRAADGAVGAAAEQVVRAACARTEVAALVEDCVHLGLAADDTGAKAARRLRTA
eukprot:7385109-Prymnesium_polylepis.3